MATAGAAQQSVQEVALLMKMADSIPPEFIRLEDEQPGATTFQGPAEEMPVVDMSESDCARRIVEAATEWGIFQVVNHGVPEAVIRALQQAAEAFFELPQEEKVMYAMAPGGKHEGYGTQIQRKGKKEWVDFLFHYVAPQEMVNYAVWPIKPEEYRTVTEEYTKYLTLVIDNIFGCLSEGLGVERNALKEAAVGGDMMRMLMKINYYPPCPRPDLTLGVEAHTDVSALTMLIANDVPGLQVFRKGCWFNTAYVPNSIIIHIGDQIETVSNGKYKAVHHRSTVSKDRVRLSLPVFCEPPEDMVIGPLPQLIDEANEPKYETMKYSEHKHHKFGKQLK